MVKKNSNKIGQSFSTDVVVVIVILLFGVLFLVAQQVNDKKTDNSAVMEQLNKQATSDSKIIFDSFKKEGIIDSKNRVDLNKLSQLNIDQLKEQLGISSDFAIVFEKDGKLVKIDSENNINCIGSPDIIVNGQACRG